VMASGRTHPISRPRTIVFVGGGTGGHLRPGVTLRQALFARHPDWNLQFLTAGRAVEKNFIAAEATCLELFPGASSRPPPWRADLYLRAWLDAMRVLARLDPDLLVFLGGYVACISRFARLKTPMVVLESNRLPGRSVRFVAPFARRIFLQWPLPAGVAWPAERVAVTGMPLGFDVLPAKRDARARLGLPRDARVLLVLGGSLGATAINERLLAGAASLAAVRDLAVLHITGAADEQRVLAGYHAAGVRAVVLPFCEEMACAYAAADLIVARAGGMTVAEIAAAGRPALFVPYPHHADAHQEWNARMLVDVGAAWLVREADAGADFVARAILPRLSDLDLLEARGKIAATLGRRDATRRIVAEIELLLELDAPIETAAAAAATA